MLFDTNVLSDFLRPGSAAKLPSTELFVRTALETDNIKIAFLTQYVVRHGPPPHWVELALPL